jgi:hypothetical protein
VLPTLRLCIALPLLATVVGCGEPPLEPVPDSKKRVLIVGIDGASDRVIGPLLAAGRLPNLARLTEEGVYGPIVSSYPLLSPRIWTSVATGKDSPKHGIEGWTRPTRRRGLHRLNYSTDRRVHALWNIVSRAGMRVGVVNWLVTYPPEIVRGVSVTSHAFPSEVAGKIFIGNVFAELNRSQLARVKQGEERGPVVYPPEWSERALDPRHLEARLTEIDNPFLDNTELPHRIFHPMMAEWFERDEQLVSIATEIRKEQDPELLMVLLQGIDRICHTFWAGVEDPAHYPEELRWSEPDRRAARAAIEQYYEFTDALIGELVKDLAADDLVIVLSDHGFEAAEKPEISRTGNHLSPDARDGILFARGRSIAGGGGSRGATVLDITPTVLAWLGLPVAEDMDGRVADFVRVERRPTIASHDVGEIQRLIGRESGSEEAILQQLKLLGYIE